MNNPEQNPVLAIKMIIEAVWKNSILYIVPPPPTHHRRKINKYLKNLRVNQYNYKSLLPTKQLQTRSLFPLKLSVNLLVKYTHLLPLCNQYYWWLNMITWSQRILPSIIDNPSKLLFNGSLTQNDVLRKQLQQACLNYYLY